MIRITLLTALTTVTLMVASAATASAGELFQFPDGFLWGTATAAHQTEGDNKNSDWWEWEKQPGNIANGDRSGGASDHYRRYAEDLKLARQMGHNAYRFSIEWARIEPEEGRFDEAQINHYRSVLESCHENGLTPMVTLFHFTLPQWLSDQGGWSSKNIVARFERFARFAGERLGDKVDLWCTLNEPVVYLGAAHAVGLFPPGQKGMGRAANVMARMAKGHVAAFRALREADTVDIDGDGKATLIGVAKHLRVFQPARRNNPLDHVAARFSAFSFNRAFMIAITGGKLLLNVPGLPHLNERIHAGEPTLDYVGVNYYSRDLVKFNVKTPGLVDRLVPEGAPVTDMGWEIYPEGFYRVLMETWKSYKLPIIVTENGMADARDLQRPGFLQSHLEAMARAMRDGVPVKGYLHWSLLDNFEWLEGFAPRFGLLKIDYRTQSRKKTGTARLYSSIIGSNSIEIGSTDEE